MGSPPVRRHLLGNPIHMGRTLSRMRWFGRQLFRSGDEGGLSLAQVMRSVLYGGDLTTAHRRHSIIYGAWRLGTARVSPLPRQLTDYGGTQTNTPVPEWLWRPQPSVSWSATVSRMFWSLWLGGGELFIKPNRNPMTGETVSFALMNPRRIGLPDDYRGDDIEQPNWTYDGIPIPGEVIHARLMSIPGEARGVGPTSPAALRLLIDREGDQSLGDFFERGAVAQYAIVNPDPKDKKQKMEVDAMWHAKHAGRRNMWSPPIFSDGWKPMAMGLNQEQKELIDMLGWNASRILSELFGIDPSMMGLPTDSDLYKNIEGRSWALWTDCLEHPVTIIEEALSLMAPPARLVDLDERKILLGTPRQRSQIAVNMALANKHNHGAGGSRPFTEPDIREVLGYR